MIKVLFICHGNICRSAMAEFVFKDMVEKENLQSCFHIESRGTSSEEIWNGIGNPIYPPAQDELYKHNIGNTAYTDFRNKRAIQLTRSDYDHFDYLLCADKNNLRNTISIVGGDPKHKVFMIIDESNHGVSKPISDPWYSGDFTTAYNDVLEGCREWLNRIKPECM